MTNENIEPREEKKSSGWKWFLIIMCVLLLVGSIMIFPKKTITCYESKEETYYETVNAKNCDNVIGCSCLHNSWLGLGACDSCSCKKTRTINVPSTKEVNWLIGSCDDEN